MYRFLMVIVFSLLLALVLAVSSAAQTNTIHHVMATVHTHQSQGEVREVEGGQAELFTTEDGITMNFRTNELEEGHVYTAWWVIVNNPENCQASPCTADDVLGNTDEVHAEITNADGIVVTETGQMQFAGYLASGEVAEAWFGNGLTNPLGAEIHIVINDHGSAIPELMDDMLTSYRAGCTDESLPPPFPDTAKADGEPGPNTCRLVQFAIFQQ